jgi:hypothetical protein
MKLAEVGRLTRPMYVKKRKPNSENLALKKMSSRERNMSTKSA